MTDIDSDGLRARISRQSEEALGRFAQELLESPVVNGVLSRAMDAREKAAQAQELAMGALNLPSAGDLERLTRRVRSVSQRLEGVEDTLDRLEERLGASAGATLDRRLSEIETQIASLATQLSRLGDQLTPTATQPVTTAAARKPTATRRRAAAAKKP
jgi:DNA repair exonuclease SbcCD ATPase subunit